MKKFLFILILFTSFSASLARLHEMPEEMRECFDAWVAQQADLLDGLRDRSRSSADKTALLKRNGLQTLSRHNYTIPVCGGVIKIPSERTRFVNFICAQGLEQKLNEGTLTQDELQALWRMFTCGEFKTMQGTSQLHNYQALMVAVEAGEYDPTVVQIPRTYSYSYPDVRDTDVVAHDDSHFVVQEFNDHQPITLAEFGEQPIGVQKEVVKAAWAGRLWNHEGNLGLAEGQCVITDLEKPDRVLPEDDPSRIEIFMANGLRDLLLASSDPEAMREFMISYFTRDKFTDGTFNSYAYFRRQVLGADI